jgi:DNA-binding NtrC family response regulator
MSLPAEITQSRPRLLFVDDERRVLNAMHIMFAEQFELFLAPHGAEALDVVRTQDIDVIVADARMPHMTGMEVLTQVRTLSPRTVRILLSDHADRGAIDGSINEGEVFRVLPKPCAPKRLRETIELAATLAREPFGAEQDSTLGAEETLEIVAGSDSVAHTGPPQRAPNLATGPGVMVFSSDPNLLEVVQRAAGGRLPVYHARNIVHVVRTLTEHRPGVLVTDVSEDEETIRAMIASLKQHMPELVTIAVSQHRDVVDMISLINAGQIFRFLRKPLSVGRCAISLQAALQHHLLLLKHPTRTKEHDAERTVEPSRIDGWLAKLKTVKRLWVAP